MIKEDVLFGRDVIIPNIHIYSSYGRLEGLLVARNGTSGNSVDNPVEKNVFLYQRLDGVKKYFVEKRE